MQIKKKTWLKLNTLNSCSVSHGKHNTIRTRGRIVCGCICMGVSVYTDVPGVNVCDSVCVHPLGLRPPKHMST